MESVGSSAERSGAGYKWRVLVVLQREGAHGTLWTVLGFNAARMWAMVQMDSDDLSAERGKQRKHMFLFPEDGTADCMTCPIPYTYHAVVRRVSINGEVGQLERKCLDIIQKEKEKRRHEWQGNVVHAFTGSLEGSDPTA